MREQEKDIEREKEREKWRGRRDGGRGSYSRKNGDMGKYLN